MESGKFKASGLKWKVIDSSNYSNLKVKLENGTVAELSRYDLEKASEDVK